MSVPFGVSVRPYLAVFPFSTVRTLEIPAPSLYRFYASSDRRKGQERRLDRSRRSVDGHGIDDGVGSRLGELRDPCRRVISERGDGADEPFGDVINPAGAVRLGSRGGLRAQ